MGLNENNNIFVYDGEIDVPHFLDKVIIGDNIRTIKEKAFMGRQIETVEIPSNVETICTGAFRNCYSLGTVIFKNGCTRIDQDAFYSCENLESVVLPTTLCSIDGSAFEDCTKLNQLILPNKLSYIGNYVFMNTGIKRLILPDSLNEHKLSNYFNDTGDIQEVFFPDKFQQKYNKSYLADIIGVDKKYIYFKRDLAELQRGLNLNTPERKALFKSKFKTR